MRIGFIDPLNADYHVGTVLERPLGGTQSAGSYLAFELAKLGHEVFYVTQSSVFAIVNGVLSLRWLAVDSMPSLKPDVLIILQTPGLGAAFRQRVPAHCKIVFQTGDTANQPVLQALRNPAEQQAYDAVVCVSEWQRAQFEQYFGLPKSKLFVLGNGFSPAFMKLFRDDEPVLPQKQHPPTLAYTSTPHRGLEWLVEAFPHIHKARPDVRLQIFSGMSVYLMSATDEQSAFGRLYAMCRTTPGIEYIGNLPQAELAKRMRSVSMLAYANVYEETSCISVMEAMAAGCAIVTSELGALPETCAGFATLVPIRDRAQYIPAFVKAVLDRLEKQSSDQAGDEAARKRQIEFVHKNYSWPIRGRQWMEMFKSIGAANT